MQAGGARRVWVKGCAADVFLNKAGLLLVGIVEKAVICFDLKEIRVIDGAVFGGGFERVIARCGAVLPLPDMGGFMGEKHGGIQAHALRVAMHIVF